MEEKKENINNEKVEQVEENNDVIDVEYPKAPLYKRWFATIIDIVLASIIGFLFFSLVGWTTNQVPAYKDVVNARNEIKYSSNLYDANGDLIINAMNDDSSTYEEKKNKLSTILDTFYLNSNFFSDNTVYMEYQNRKKEYKNSSGNLIFVLDEKSEEDFEIYIEGSYLAEDYYNFYVSELEIYAINYLSTNENYHSYTQAIIWTSILEIYITFGLGFFVSFNLIPIFRKRGRQTIGMYLFKISVVTHEAITPKGKTFVFRQLYVFFVGYAFDVVTAFIPLVVSITMMHLSKSGQDFFDYMTNTYVIDSSKRDVYLSYNEYFSRNKGKEEMSLSNPNLVQKDIKKK